MVTRVTLDLTPQLAESLGRLEKIFQGKTKAELIFDALNFYEDILRRALGSGKIRLAEEGAMHSAANRVLERRMRLAASVGLVPLK